MTTSIQGERERARLVERLMIPQRPGKCERCNYDDADPDLAVPEYYADCYMAVCEGCYMHLSKLQYNQSNWGEY